MEAPVIAAFISAALAGAGGAFGAWGAVRYELGRTAKQAETAHEAAQRAHQRIDNLQQQAKG